MLLRRCPKCGKYTLKDTCEECNARTNDAHPARFSPQDKRSPYRYATKAKRGLLPQQQPDIQM